MSLSSSDDVRDLYDESADAYGGSTDVIARRYRKVEVVDAVTSAGFGVTTHSVRSVDDFDMDAIYLFAIKH